MQLCRLVRGDHAKGAGYVASKASGTLINSLASLGYIGPVGTRRPGALGTVVCLLASRLDRSTAFSWPRPTLMWLHLRGIITEEETPRGCRAYCDLSRPTTKWSETADDCHSRW